MQQTVDRRYILLKLLTNSMLMDQNDGYYALVAPVVCWCRLPGVQQSVTGIDGC